MLSFGVLNKEEEEDGIRTFAKRRKESQTMLI
jgi:hypothetical protein